MVKLPSIQSLVTQSATITKRFPLTVLCSILLSGILIYCTHLEWNMSDSFQFFLGKISMCSMLGLSLFLGTSLLSEAGQHNRKSKIFLQAISFILIVVYYFSIDSYEEFNFNTFTRFSLYIIAAHMLVAFAPYTGANRINGFWQFNKILFLRFLLALLYVVVLYLGISLALWLIHDLLHVEITYKKYLYVWYFLSGIVNTFIFLGGIPKNLSELENNVSYPQGLKAFTQFVLLPLVTIYLFILYIYFGKIIIIWSLPKGYISYLVISFSIMGILSLLLIYPIRNNEDNKWIKIFSRWFYVALYPLIILLGISIFHRVADYGITEHRYFILILAIWLVFIASYFLVGKKENIKLIPITLFILAVATSVGPWGAFSLSHHSQKNRLEKILVANGILVNGKITKDHKGLSDSARENVNSILDYMDKANTLDIIQPWFNINIDSIDQTAGHNHYKKDVIEQAMGLTSAYPQTSFVYETSFELQPDNSQLNAFTIKGFDFFSDFSYNHFMTDPVHIDTTQTRDYFLALGDSVALVPYHSVSKYGLVKNGKTVAVMDLSELTRTLYRQSDTAITHFYVKVPKDKFYYEVAGLDSVLYYFRFYNIRVTKNGNVFSTSKMGGWVLTKHL